MVTARFDPVDLAFTYICIIIYAYHLEFQLIYATIQCATIKNWGGYHMNWGGYYTNRGGYYTN